MTTQAALAPPASSVHVRPGAAGSVLLLGAPLAALLAGIAAEWLDFRALRVPLLAMVGLGVLATSYAISGTRAGVRPALTALITGVATWAAAETVYVGIHLARGEPFHAERFGPQPAQAVGLIAAHGLFLGAPTGLAAAALLHLPRLRGRTRRR